MNSSIVLLSFFFATPVLVAAIFTIREWWALRETKTPAERHPRASIHVGHPYNRDRDRVATPKEPHVGFFDDTAFESVAYKALVAGAEERIDRLHRTDRSDL